MSTIAHPRSVPSGPSGKTVAGVLVGAVLAVAVGYGVVTLGEPVSGQVSQPAGSGADQVITQKAAELAATKAAAVARGEHMQAINELGFGESAANGADQLFIQRAAELAAEQAALARTERMVEINELGFGESAANGADQLFIQRAAELAAEQAALARTERMVEINETWPLPSTSSVAGFSLDGASHALPEYIRDELRRILSTPSAADFGLDGASHALPDYIRAQIAGQTQNAQYESQIDYLTEQWMATFSGADQVYKQKGAELAATEEARRRGERMAEINSGWEPAKLESGGPKSPLTVE